MAKIKTKTKDLKDLFKRNKKLILLVLLLLLGFLAITNISKGYHKKEIKALEAQIAAKEADFKAAVAEKERFKDSTAIYEAEAEQFGAQAAEFKAKAEKQRKEKEAALAALRNLPKEVIDTFFVNRYASVPKSGVDLALDKSVGNEVVIELTEKDHLVGELVTVKSENNSLTSQVGSLTTSLGFSKLALASADSAIAIRSQQLDLSKQANDLLKKDLKTAKKKAFWNKFKGAGLGVTAGILLGLLVK